MLGEVPVTKISLIHMIILIFMAACPPFSAANDQDHPLGPVAQLTPMAFPDRSQNPEATQGQVRVEIRQKGAAFQIFREGEPYFIKGIGGRHYLETAAAAGANSIRTWDPRDAGMLLDRAKDLEMTVMVGVWLSHYATDYTDPCYRERKIDEVRNLVENYKHHPALLMWSLGNEINLEGGDTNEAWLFLDELARLIKELDPNHPVITVISYNGSTLDTISVLAPHLDAVGINAYAAVDSLRNMIDGSFYMGPYIITEWGVDGHWEALQTSWGRPIEATSALKEEWHLMRYNRNILANSDRCIGSYVFLWGQKQERTSTWYSMFQKDILGTDTGAVSFPAVDAMHYNWTGTWPHNRAPQVWSMLINDVSAENNIILSPNEPMVSKVKAGDPDNDELTYIWELLEEPVDLGIGGSYEARPRTLVSVKGTQAAMLNLRAPGIAGQYRLFVYVLDNNGHAGTANIPFQVGSSQDYKIMADLHAQGLN
jgi:hypothetical protein